MGTVPASHLAGITLGRNHIGLLAGRPEILRFTTRCRQLCDDYIPWLRFKGNYFITSDDNSNYRLISVPGNDSGDWCLRHPRFQPDEG